MSPQLFSSCDFGINDEGSNASAGATESLWGRSRTLCPSARIYSARRAKTRGPNAYPSGGHKASQQFRLSASSESAVGQSPRLLQQTPTAPGDARRGQPAKPRPDKTLIRALARAHRWKRLLEEGTHRSAHEIAEMTWKRRGGRKVIIAPDGGDAWAPASPSPDEALIRALARRIGKRMLEEGGIGRRRRS